MTYDNSNRFTLNKNLEKRDAKDRDYKGSVNIDGREYWLSGYIKQGANGAFISGTVKPKEPSRSVPTAFQKRSIIPDDSDVPF